MKTCSTCKTSKPEEEFAKRTSKCKPCHRAYTRQHYQDNKVAYLEKAQRHGAAQKARNQAVILNHLATHPCVDCGESDYEVLEFDHVDPTAKLGNVGNMIKSSTQTLLSEIAKCEVRCSNCHVRKTRRQLGWWTRSHHG